MKILTLGALLIASFAFADAPANLLKPTNKEDTWQFQQVGDGKGTMKADGDAMVFTVTNADDTNWHVQAFQSGLDLTNGKEYVLKFQVKASEPRDVRIMAMIDQEDWHAIGLSETISCETEFKPQEFTFTADNVAPKKNRIDLVLGDAKGVVTVKDMTLTAK